MSDELKACPFCGGDAGAISHIQGTLATLGRSQHSKTCPLRGWVGFYNETPEATRDAWNTRATDAENQRLRAEVEALREALERIADDPYQYGVRVQKMKRIAADALTRKAPQ